VLNCIIYWLGINFHAIISDFGHQIRNTWKVLKCGAGKG